MTQLNKTTTKLIKDTLNQTMFSLSSYEIDYPDTGKTLATIKFLIVTDYYFSILKAEQENQYSNNYVCGYCPGDVQLTKWVNTYGDGFEGCIKEISQWSKNITEELVCEDKNLRFSKEELVPIREEMTQVKEEIQKLRDDLTITQEQFAKLEQTVDELNKNAERIPKAVWKQALINFVNTVAVESGNAIVKIGISKIFRLPPGTIQ